MIKKNVLKILLVVCLFIFGYFLYNYNQYKNNQPAFMANLSEYIQANTKKIQMYLDQKSNEPTNFDIALSPRERAFLIKNMQQSKNYLEFGAGGSTFLALLYSDTNIVTVESDKNWINYMKKWNVMKNNDNKRVHFDYIDIGPVKEWGFPIETENNKNLFPAYSSKVFADFNNEYDLVFIDGRFRVACALQTILQTNADTKIIMHDFTIRPYYHTILEFLDIIKVVDTMVLFKQKKNIDKDKVKKLYDKYKFVTE